MRDKIIGLFLLFTCFILNSEAFVSRVDLYNYNFAGYRMNFNQQQIIKELSKQDSRYEVKTEIDRNNSNNKYVSIVSRNTGFNFNLYNDKISSFSKNGFNKYFFEKLLRGIKNYSVKSLGNNQKEYRTGDFIIIFIEPARDDDKNLLIIKNAKVEAEIWENQNPAAVEKKVKEEVKKYYKPTITNLRFRESPTLEGKFIRLLVKDEKMELLEQGKEETINNIKGRWIKVKTEKGEVGWAFSGYLEEIK